MVFVLAFLFGVAVALTQSEYNAFMKLQTAIGIFSFLFFVCAMCNVQSIMKHTRFFRMSDGFMPNVRANCLPSGSEMHQQQQQHSSPVSELRRAERNIWILTKNRFRFSTCGAVNLDIKALWTSLQTVARCPPKSACLKNACTLYVFGLLAPCSFSRQFCFLFQNASLLGLDGTVPSEIGLLTKLTALHIWRNNFTGQIPSTIGSRC